MITANIPPPPAEIVCLGWARILPWAFLVILGWGVFIYFAIQWGEKRNDHRS